MQLSARRSALIAPAVYVLMLAGAVAAFLWIRQQGMALVAPPPSGQAFGSAAATPAASLPSVPLPGAPAPPAAAGAGPARNPPEVLPHLLLALATILLAARAVGAVFRRLGQPPVVGEVLAGILLGPSLLGRISPAALAFLLPPSVAPALGILAQVGVIVFMFLVGLELDPDAMGQRTQATIAISLASITVPFVLGALLALPL